MVRETVNFIVTGGADCAVRRHLKVLLGIECQEASCTSKSASVGLMRPRLLAAKLQGAPLAGVQLSSHGSTSERALPEVFPEPPQTRG